MTLFIIDFVVLLYWNENYGKKTQNWKMLYGVYLLFNLNVNLL